MIYNRKLWRYVMHRLKHQETFLGHPAMFLSAFVAWCSHGHIPVKNITPVVNFVRKYPWPRRNIPWLRNLNPPPLLGIAWSLGRMIIMSHSHVVPMCLTICPKNSHSVSVFNYLSKRTPMVTMCLTLCPKRTPTNAYLPWCDFL